MAKYDMGKVIPEEPGRGESQSVEEAGKFVREFARVLKEYLEDKAEMTLRPEEDIAPWMMRWAAMLCTRYLDGKGGLAAYGRP